ncbi:hypothetical protein CHUAL_000056 [Chamberlinius hualienensis]
MFVGSYTWHKLQCNGWCIEDNNNLYDKKYLFGVCKTCYKLLHQMDCPAAGFFFKEQVEFQQHLSTTMQ